MRFESVRAWRVRAGVVGAVVTALAAAGAQGGIMLEFTGMDLVYDGNSLRDAGSPAGGVADPANADPLASLDVWDNGVLVGTLSNDIFLDVFIPDVVSIPSASGTVHAQTTPGNPGFFDLLIGTSPLASEFLLLDLNSVSVVYTDISGIAQFVFGAAVSSSSAQNLPFGLVVGDPVTVSFSAQVVPGSLTSAGGFLTGFLANGTGEFNAVPGPGAGLVMGLGAMGVLARRRR